MTTVLFADRDGSSLGPLGDRTVPALLPVQSTLLLEKFIQELVSNGIRSALLVVGPRANEIKKRFGKGLRWGIALEYVVREEAEAPADVLRRLEQRLDGDTLVFRADIGAEDAIREFLARLHNVKAPIAAATAGGRPAGFWRIQPSTIKKLTLPRDPHDPDWVLASDHTPVPLGAELELLDSLAAYRKRDHGEKPAVSDRAMVDPKARLGPGTTVAEDAFVCTGARLTETSVLPRTVIPQGVNLEGCVVSGNLTVDVATAKTALLTDQLPAESKGSPAPGALSRVLGILLFLFSLPLWPAALIWSLIANAGHARRPFRFMGNVPGKGPRVPISTFQFETAIPAFRDLPLLLALISGQIALTGVAPLSPEDSRNLEEGWQRVREEAPVGLIAPSRLIVPAAAGDEVRLIVDAFHARSPMPGLIGLGVSSFFSSRGWTAPRAFNPDDIKELPV